MSGFSSLTRRPSNAWSRLKAPQTDILESIGLPSKGDNRLLDYKTQEMYYQKIVDRYMQFCAAAGREDDTLDRAFASLSLNASGNSATSVGKTSGAVDSRGSDRSSGELATLLFSMRKLREGILASSRTDNFTQRAYVFVIRAAILTSTYESYQPALLHLLHKIHPVTKLPPPELHEFIGCLILDLACRLGDYGEAFAVRRRWKYRDDRVEGILKALVHDDWVGFWRLRSVVDGYQRRIIDWAEEGMRTHALKCLGRSYLTADRKYVEHCAGRGWTELVEKNAVGWELDEERVTIRRTKVK